MRVGGWEERALLKGGGDNIKRGRRLLQRLSLFVSIVIAL